MAPYELPEEDRRRLTRTEMLSLQWMLNIINTLAYAQDDLGKRLEMIPDGKQRMKTAMEMVLSIVHDLCGTVPERQNNHIDNTTRDMKAQIVPKMTPTPVTVVLTKADATELVDAAQIKCAHCAEFNEASEKGCKLRKLLEVVVPLETYSGLICPYSKAKWED